MSILQRAAMVFLFISGAVAVMASMFFAEGAIAENYTDQTFAEPRFFLILVIWGMGAVLFIVQRMKRNVTLFIISVTMMLGAFPIGFPIATYWSLKASGQI